MGLSMCDARLLHCIWAYDDVSVQAKEAALRIIERNPNMASHPEDMGPWALEIVSGTCIFLCANSVFFLTGCAFG